MSKLIIVAIGWLFFGGLHSALLHSSIKEKLQDYFDADDQSYRLIYTLVAVISFFAASLITLVSDGVWVKHPDTITFIGGGILIFGSLYLLRISFKNYDLMVFIGLQPDEKQQLHISGMNRYVRHPLYLSTVLLLIGVAVFWPTDVVLVACLVMIAYTLLGAKLEEQKLIAQFGKPYIDYMKEVPAFIPKFK